MYLFLAVPGLRCGMLAFSSCCKQGLLRVQCVGFPSEWLLLPQRAGCRHTCLRSCGPRAQSLWCVGLAALRHVDYSKTRAHTCLLHWRADSLALSPEGSPIKLKHEKIGPWGGERTFPRAHVQMGETRASLQALYLIQSSYFVFSD